MVDFSITIAMQISTVMLIFLMFSNQISGGEAKVLGGGRTTIGGLPLVEKIQKDCKGILLKRKYLHQMRHTCINTVCTEINIVYTEAEKLVILRQNDLKK